MAFWVVKCREKMADGGRGWHWQHFFRPGNKAFDRASDWGGRHWIKSSRSCMYLRDSARKGDIVVCYQYEGRQIMGLTRMVRNPTKDGDEYNTMWFAARNDSLNLIDLDPPLDVRRLRASGCDPHCFRTNTPGTVYALGGKEFGGILSTIEEQYPGLRKQLRRWLEAAGYRAE